MRNASRPKTALTPILAFLLALMMLALLPIMCCGSEANAEEVRTEEEEQAPATREWWEDWPIKVIDDETVDNINFTTEDDWNDGGGLGYVVTNDDDGEMRLNYSRDYGDISPPDEQITELVVNRNGIVFGILNPSGKVFFHNPANEEISYLNSNNSINGEPLASITICDDGTIFVGSAWTGKLLEISSDLTSITNIPIVPGTDFNLTHLATDGGEWVYGGYGPIGKFFSYNRVTFQFKYFDPHPMAGDNYYVTDSTWDEEGNLYFSTSKSGPGSIHIPDIYRLREIDLNNISRLQDLDTPVYGDGPFAGIISLAYTASGYLFGGTAEPANIFKYQKTSTGSNYQMFGTLDINFRAVLELEMGFDDQTMFGSTLGKPGNDGVMFSFDIHDTTLGSAYSPFDMDYHPLHGVTAVTMNPSFASIYGGTDPDCRLFRMYPIAFWVGPILNTTQYVMPLAIELSGYESPDCTVITLFKHGSNETTTFEKPDWDFVVSQRKVEIPKMYADQRCFQIAVGIFSTNPLDNDASSIVEWCDFTFERQVDLDIEMSVLDKEVVPGDEIDYKLYLNSSAYGLIPDLVVDLDLPANTEFISSSHPDDNLAPDGTVRWKLEDMKGPFNQVINLTLRTKDSIVAGSQVELDFIANFTDAIERYQDEITSNTVSTTIVIPSMTINLTGSSGELTLGDEVSYSLAIENVGDGVANDTMVLIEIPADLTVDDITAGSNEIYDEGSPLIVGDEFYQYVWELGNLTSSTKFEATLTATVNNDAKDGTSFLVSAQGEFRVLPGASLKTLKSTDLPLNIRRPDVEVDVFPTVSETMSSGSLSYTINVENVMSGDATVEVRVKNPEHCSNGMSDADEFMDDGATSGWSNFSFVVKGNTDLFSLDLKYKVDAKVPDMTIISTEVEVIVKVANGYLVENFTLDVTNVTVLSPHMTMDLVFSSYEIHTKETISLTVWMENIGNGTVQSLELTSEFPESLNPSLRSGSSTYTKDDLGTEGWELVIDDSTIVPEQRKAYTIDITGTDEIVNNTLIRISVHLKVLDADGNDFSYTIVNQSIRGYADPLPEDEDFVVLSMVPYKDANNIPITTTIRIVFNHDIDETSILTSTIVIQPLNSMFVVSADGNVITITFQEELEYNTKYSVLIKTEIKDIHGNQLVEDEDWSFTTEKDPSSGSSGAINPMLIIVVVVLFLLLMISVVLFIFLRKKKKDNERLTSDDVEEAEIAYTPDSSLSKGELNAIGGDEKEKEPQKAKVLPSKKQEAIKEDKPLQIPEKAGRTVKGPAGARTVRKPPVRGAKGGAIPERRPAGATAEAEVFEYMPEGAQPMETVDAVPSDQPRPVQSDRDLNQYFDDVPEHMKQPETAPTPDKPIDGQLQLPPAVVVDAEDEGKAKDYKIQEILVMTKDGMLMQHFTQGTATTVDEDILASMLTAVQTFIKDTFDEDRGELNDISFGKFRIVMTRGDYITIACVATGKKAHLIKKQLERAVKDIEAKYYDVLEGWDGDMESVEPMRDEMKYILEGKYDMDFVE